MIYKGNPLVTYSNVQGGYTGTGNININPVFSGTGCEANDFMLIIGSPSIDAGNPNSEYNDACFPPSHNTFINDMGA